MVSSFFGFVNSWAMVIIKHGDLFDSMLSRAALKFTKGVHHTLTPRQLCDFECIANQAFKPLQTFLNRQDYESVVEDARLANGRGRL